MAKKRKTRKTKKTSKRTTVKTPEGSENETVTTQKAAAPEAGPTNLTPKQELEALDAKILKTKEEGWNHAIDFFTRKSRSYAKIGFAVQKYLGLLEVKKRVKVG